MCGIAGIVGEGPREVRAALLARMTDAIAHRGPDDSGHWTGDTVAMGMRRLSIIDLESGHQPMWRDDGIGIVFNGEIYNYRALMKHLEGLGYSFRTHSDTEVLLHLYHRYGLDAVDRLEGMFAFALYDMPRGVLHLVRDRFGVKPLYYGDFDGRLLFASEIKGILAALEGKPELNLEALDHYLALRYVPGPESIWRGIFRLPPGTTLSLDLATGTRSQRRYWRIHYDSRPEEEDRPYLREFEERFLAAVDKRLLASDVPVGVLLSGGLDSSAVSMAASMLGHHDLHTFSVAFDDGGDFDETGYARQIAAKFGTRHHEVRIGRDQFLETLPMVVHHADEPIADLAAVPLLHVCRLSRQHVKAVLSGEGSDEIFAGYDLEHIAARFERLATLAAVLPRPILRAAGRFLGGRHGGTLRALGDRGLAGYLRARASQITSDWAASEKPGLWRTPPGGTATEDLIRAWYDATQSKHPLDQLQDVMIESWLVEDLLMKADKMSMAVSLELREPFLDHHLAEWAAKLPQSWRVGSARTGRVSKRILREFCRDRLPESVLTRPKRGFPVPAYAWLAGPVGDWARGLLRDPKSRVRDLFQDTAVEQIVSAARSGDAGAARRTWNLIIAELWLRHWL